MAFSWKHRPVFKVCGFEKWAVLQGRFKAAESESDSALHDRGALIANNENKILVSLGITGKGWNACQARQRVWLAYVSGGGAARTFLIRSPWDSVKPKSPLAALCSSLCPSLAFIRPVEE